ncbi:MAG TPA: NADP-dependent oxidoreductase [Streptosporangiaceae bacterium]|nr:NADP-dependent oxidoreductase [Streptosporangiaceae bacterium]
MVTARELVLSRRPEGRIDPGCFTLVQRKLPALSPGQLHVRADCFSVDPSMIPRLSADTYAPAFGLGAAVEARAVGQVMQSTAEGWAEGDWAVCWAGWRDHAVVEASQAIRIQPRSGLPPHTWLHVLGVPGLTAYIGLIEVARMQPGDRVWVSAAAGAVGSVAAQLARARGASLVIGSAGGADKARYLTDTLGLDAAVDYRAGDLVGQLREVAPEGIDLYFDNVGGDHLEAAIDLLRTDGRAAICGMISGYGRPPASAPCNLTQLIIKRLRLEGFLVLDHLHRRAAFEEQVLPLVEDGILHSEVTIFDGLESAPQALLSLLDGAKLGKALVRP